MALLEGTRLDYRDGRIVNANMSDYLVPVNADVPALDAAFLPGEDKIADPLGVKGLGELVIVGVPRRHRQCGVQRDGQARHGSADQRWRNFSSQRGSARYWRCTCCLDTPSSLPISVHESPAMRAANTASWYRWRATARSSRAADSARLASPL